MNDVRAKEKVQPQGGATPAADQPLYASHQKVYPKAVSGTVRRAKWAVLIACLGLYYLIPWIRWDRGPDAPSQAVLVDMGHGRLYFFFFEIWPQEVYFLTGLLVLGAIGLFAAIPAVIAYNRFSARVNRYEARLQRFADKVHAGLSRELDKA
jgi:hypothetical protein